MRFGCLTVGIAVVVVLGSLPAAAQGPSARATTGRATPPALQVPRILPGTRAEVFTTIQGNALTSNNGILADAMVRLRDARQGHIVDTTKTDKAGLFTFHSIDPGSYVIELVGEDHTILAASQMLNVNAGEVVSAVVKLPFRIAPLAGVLGHSVASAAIVAAAAAASGVLATQVAGADVSPRR
jgi:hypothetical protein